MGLLTDPRTGTGKMIKFILRREKLLCFLLYISGIIYTMMLAVPIFNDRKNNFLIKIINEWSYQLKSLLIQIYFILDTYFSENALLPGLVTKESNLDQTSKQFYNELLDEMKRYPDTMPYAWLSAKFNQLHLDTFIHNFSLIYPFKQQKVNKWSFYIIT